MHENPNELTVDNSVLALIDHQAWVAFAVDPIDRVSTNAWADIKPAVAATGRRSLVMAGRWTEVCVAQTALSAISDGCLVWRGMAERIVGHAT